MVCLTPLSASPFRLVLNRLSRMDFFALLAMGEGVKFALIQLDTAEMCCSVGVSAPVVDCLAEMWVGSVCDRS